MSHALIATAGVPATHVPYCYDCTPNWRGRETKSLENAWIQCDHHDVLNHLVENVLSVSPVSGSAAFHESHEAVPEGES